MANNNRPKIDLKLNEPVRLKLLREPYEGENQYGPYYLYTVEESGVEKVYFATQEVHMKIQQSRLVTGDEFILEKTASQKGKKVITEITFEAMPAERTNGNGSAVERVGTPGDNLKAIMLQCLKDAVEVTHALEGVPTENIQKLATTLFIQRARR